MQKHLNSAEELSEVYDLYAPVIFGLIKKSITDTIKAEILLLDIFEQFSKHSSQVSDLYKKTFTILFCICNRALKNVQQNAAATVAENIISRNQIAIG
ncbi:hypothetical protein BH09BAC2_BH09BAC2_12270 [soil metagenome]